MPPIRKRRFLRKDSVMSEVNKRTVCASCGAVWGVPFGTCPSCGKPASGGNAPVGDSRVGDTQKYAHAASAEKAVENMREENAATRVENSSARASADRRSEGGGKWYSGILEKLEPVLSPIVNFLSTPRRIVGAVLIFAVALLMLLLAFAPIVYTKTEIDGDDYSVGYNIVDIVEIGVISLISLHEGDIEDTKYYEEIEDFDFDRITSSKRAKVPNAIKNAMCVQMMRYDTPVRVIGPVAVIIAVVYIVLLLVFLVSAIKTLVCAIIAYVRKEEMSEARISVSARLLWTALAFLPVLAFAAKQLFSFPSGSVLLAFASYGTGMSWGFIFAAIIAICASLYFAARGAVIMAQNGGVTEKNGVISLLLAFVVLLSTVMPIFSADLAWAKRGGIVEGSIGIGASDVCEVTSDVLSDYAGYSYTTHVEYLAEAIPNYHTDLDGFDMLNRALIGCARFNPAFLYFTTILLTLITLISWVVLIRRLSARLLLGLESKKSGKTEMVLILLSSIAMCIIVLIMSIMANEALLSAESFTAVFNIGTAPVLALVASVGMLVMSKKDDRLKIEGGYDNADISHAPYVLR